jgi:hypothetical protein
VHDDSVGAFLFLHKCPCELQEGFWKIHKDVLVGHGNECYKELVAQQSELRLCEDW